MLSFKDKIRPWKTIRLLVQLCEGRAMIIEQLKAVIAKNETIIEQQKTMLELQKEMNAAQCTNHFDLQQWTSTARYVN